jgi:hypothetical protein
MKASKKISQTFGEGVQGEVYFVINLSTESESSYMKDKLRPSNKMYIKSHKQKDRY